MSTPVTIVPLLAADPDITRLGKIHILGFQGDPSPANIANWVERIAHILRTGACGFKAVKDDFVVGYVLWNKPGWRYAAGHDAATGGEDALTFHDLMALECQAARDEVMGGKRHWYLRQLVVDPAHQRQGIASRLLEALFATIWRSTEAQQLPLALAASQDGVALYRTKGFEYGGPCQRETGTDDEIWVKQAP